MLLLLKLSEFNPGNLIIHTERTGTISETTTFLTDLERVYTGLLHLEGAVCAIRHPRHPFPPELLWEFGPPVISRGFDADTSDPAMILPEFRLELRSVRIESPGFWEFVGSLNPLQQIREYLNDRHKRRQDKEFREAAEAEKLRLENELVQRAIWEKEGSVLRERIGVLRELGYSDLELRQLIWSQVGRDFAKLGTHQDSKMIEDAEQK